MRNFHYVVSPKMEHLTEEQLSELLDRYYTQNEKVSILISDYKINIKTHEFSRLLPHKVYHDKICPYCGKNGITKLPSKANISFIKSEKIQCPECSHDFSPSCTCISCREIEENKKKALINDLYDLSKNSAIEPSSLTPLEKIYLSGLMRATYNHDFSLFSAYDDVIFKLAPTKDLEFEIFKLLVGKKVIVVHPASNIAAFSQENFPHSYFPSKVKYSLNLSGNLAVNVKDFFNLSLSDLDIDSKETLLSIWRHIALYECFEYLYTKMHAVGLNFNAGEKTYLVFNELLNHFSVGQVMNIIYRSIGQATHQILERSLTKKHGANMVISNCQSYGEKALANRWDIKCYHRDFDCSISILAELIYNRILQVGDKGFSVSPNVTTIIESLTI